MSASPSTGSTIRSSRRPPGTSACWRIWRRPSTSTSSCARTTSAGRSTTSRGADLLRRYLFDPILNIDGIVGGHHGAGTKTLLPHEVRAKMHVRLVPNMEPDDVRGKLLAHLKKIGCSDFEVDFEEGYPW